MSWVYFIREGLDGNVKIGTTTSNPHSRRRSMQTGNSSDLVLLAAVQGDDGLEKRLHARFAGARLRGEWFTPTVELLAFIEGVLLSHPLPEDNGDDAWPFTAEQAEWMWGFIFARARIDAFTKVIEEANSVLESSPQHVERRYAELLAFYRHIGFDVNPDDSPGLVNGFNAGGCGEGGVSAFEFAAYTALMRAHSDIKAARADATDPDPDADLNVAPSEDEQVH